MYSLDCSSLVHCRLTDGKDDDVFLISRPITNYNEKLFSKIIIIAFSFLWWVFGQQYFLDWSKIILRQSRLLADNYVCSIKKKKERKTIKTQAATNNQQVFLIGSNKIYPFCFQFLNRKVKLIGDSCWYTIIVPFQGLILCPKSQSSVACPYI